jgi:AhpD family alkylhydroperoxidase
MITETDNALAMPDGTRIVRTPLHYPTPTRLLKQVLHSPMPRYDDFQAFRSALNRKILGSPATDSAPAVQGQGTLVTKRFFALDDQTYRDTSHDSPPGLNKKTKELLGLSASLVLRCDDCIAYHIDQAVSAGASDRELWETFDIGLIVGGSIVIPHLRRAVEFLEECRARSAQSPPAS